ncbi:hypothetical protein RRG08_054248 [Elysia crispata]|uniref:Uncharacterized protein n=1 Tax=Elysia crispata TaxID=231223 RepID=A0AAE0YBT1_9GAST|nr:hypothetical protein RRG08_054248 [Elysia crispata]
MKRMLARRSTNVDTGEIERIYVRESSVDNLSSLWTCFKTPHFDPKDAAFPAITKKLVVRTFLIVCVLKLVKK